MKFRYKIYSIVFLLGQLLLNSTIGNGQLQAYKKGLASFEKGYYDLAINDLLKVAEIADSEKANLNFKIAESYRLSNRWIAAIPFYESALLAGLNNADAVFYLAYAYKVNEQYDLASNQFQAYIQKKTDNKLLNERANREINALQLVESIKAVNNDVFFRNLKEVNSEGSDFGTLVFNNQLIFASSRKDKKYANGLPYLGLYSAPINNDLTSIGKIDIFSPAIYDAERNEASPTVSPDGKIMIFARGNSGKRKDISPDVDLYITRNVPGSGWTEPSLVTASDSSSWDGCPAFSRDGKTLYFASNRAGGSGGMDIYRVNMDASGRFGNPTNMGKAINTPGDEMFPFVSPDGKLYFASDGHPGLGKLDLFVAVRKSGKISVENMGLPYNSSRDDFGFAIDAVGNMFFSSNRAGGMGDDDIYFYQAPPSTNSPENPVAGNNDAGDKTEKEDLKTVNYYLAGKVLDKQNNKPLLETKISILTLDGGLETVFTEVNTDSTGSFGPVALSEDTDYILIANKEDYLTKRESFTMYGRSIPYPLLQKKVTDTTFQTQILLDNIFVGKTFTLENIYYDLDKADIRPDAAVELDKLVQILVDNPGIKIELGSHTDSRGSNIYNIRLSQRRADSAIEYLIAKGIERARLTAQGYGETELKILDAKTEDEHQVNRRTEFKVVEIAKGPIESTGK